MLRLSLRNVVLTAATTWMAWGAPAEAQIYGRLPGGNQEGGTNASCGFPDCQPNLPTFGHYHENWRRWPEDDRSDLIDKLSPFTTPAKGTFPDSVIPESRDEDLIAPRSRNTTGSTPSFVAPNRGLESIPSPPTRSDSLELPDSMPADDLPSDNFSTDTSSDTGLPGSGGAESSDGLFPDLEQPEDSGGISQPETDSDDLNDIFNDFGRRMPPQRGRIRQLRRPPMTQRRLSSIPNLQHFGSTGLHTGIDSKGKRWPSESTNGAAPAITEQHSQPNSGSSKLALQLDDSKKNPLRREAAPVTTPAVTKPKTERPMLTASNEPLPQAQPQPQAPSENVAAAYAAAQHAAQHAANRFAASQYAPHPHPYSSYAPQYTPNYAGVPPQYQYQYGPGWSPQQPTPGLQGHGVPVPRQLGGQFAPEYASAPTYPTGQIPPAATSGAPVQRQPIEVAPVQQASATIEFEDDVTTTRRNNPLRK